jgi:ABC-2 type transport system permease protein
MRGILAVMFREFRIRATSMIWLFYDLCVPLIYLLLFGVAFNGAFNRSAVGETAVPWSYQAFFLPGVLAMAGFGIAINTAYGFFVDRENGIFYEHLTYPLSRPEYLFGKILFNCLLALAQAGLTLLLAVFVLGIPIAPGRLVLLIPGVVLGTAGWFFFLTVFAIRIRRNDIFGTFLNAVYYILMFASTIFYPFDVMPRWLQTLVLMNPLTWHTDILRWTTGGSVAGNLMWEVVGFVVFTGIFFREAIWTLDTRIIE